MAHPRVGAAGKCGNDGSGLLAPGQCDDDEPEPAGLVDPFDPFDPFGEFDEVPLDVSLAFAEESVDVDDFDESEASDEDDFDESEESDVEDFEESAVSDDCFDGLLP